jgi:ubiquitin-protein ligase
VKLFSTIDLDAMLTGIDATFPATATPEDVVAFVERQCRDRLRSSHSVLLFSGAGERFTEPTLRDVDASIAHALYVVFYTDMPDELLSRPIRQFCPIGEHQLAMMLAPLSRQTRSGLCQLVVLLSYLQAGGERSMDFLNIVSAITGFAPLVVGLWNIIHSKMISGYQLIAVSAALEGLFRQMIHIESKGSILDYTLKCASFLMAHECPTPITVTHGRWLPSAERMPLPRCVPKAIDGIFSLVEYLRPRKVSEIPKGECLVVAQVDPCIALISRSATAPPDSVHLVTALAPPQDVALSRLRPSQFRFPALVPKSAVHQVVVFLVESAMPADNLYFANLVIQLCLDQFEAISPVFAGLAFYGKTTNLAIRPTAEYARFRESFDVVRQNGPVELWSAIVIAMETLRNARRDLPNAILRVVVIGQTEDLGEGSLVELANELLQSRVILDALWFGRNRALGNMARVSGGHYFVPETFQEGLSFIAQTAFVDLRVRPVQKPTCVTDALLRREIRSVKLIPNVKIERAQTQIREKLYGKDIGLLPITHPEFEEPLRRELLAVDDSLLGGVYVATSDHWDLWFMAAHLGNHRWIEVAIHIPMDWPYQPPEFYLLNVVPHINVAPDGRIRMRLLEKDYDWRNCPFTLIFMALAPLMLEGPDPESPADLSLLARYESDEMAFRRQTDEAIRRSPEVDIGKYIIESSQ